MKKLIFALIVIAALLVVAMPVAAQGPTPYNPVASWYNRTSQMTAAWVGDPFGGNPRLPVEVSYAPDGKGGVTAKLANASFPYTGIVAKFGPSPFAAQDILPGGIPSSMSGDGSAPRKAIYIGGAWADPNVNPKSQYASFLGSTLEPDRNYNETPIELPACATVKIPAGSSKWFKLDTWKQVVRGQVSGKGTADTFSKVATQIWVDDELDGATQPSGSAVFGAANKYMWGTADEDYWSQFAANQAPQTREDINGYFMAVYGPDFLQPNYAFAPPNAWIFTLAASGTGSLSRSCTAAAFAGQPCVTAASGGNSMPAGNSSAGVHTNWSTEMIANGVPQAGTVAIAISTMGTFNPSQPSHLLWSDGTYDGWVFVRVINQMIWDGTASVCSYRNVVGN
jgi:hypothetical protein